MQTNPRGEPQARPAPRLFQFANAVYDTEMTSAQPLSSPVLVLLGGVVAGASDILFATAFWNLKADVPAYRILQSIAAGLLGAASFQGGFLTAALGLALHFLIAVTMSITYYAVARRWPVLHRRPWVCGLLYGLGAYGVMTFIVVPLSAALPASRDTLWIVLSVLVHMLLIGVPIGLATREAVRGLAPYR
jgi:hypothetical protein